jgi:hypothetical protein
LEVVLDYLSQGEVRSRAQLLSRFSHDDRLVQSDSNGVPGPGVRFDQPADAGALRNLRMAARSGAASYAGFVMVADSGMYSLYVRDELPDAVSQSYAAFLSQGQMWLTP